MIFRSATDADADQLESFDIGNSASWLGEVSEILTGLLAWRSDPQAEHLDRQVIVAVEGDHLVAVTAHERLSGRKEIVWVDHRYLMVTAVRSDHRRMGTAQELLEFVFADLKATGCQSVEWLVHPSNRPSIEFSRRVFPEADETQPPEDDPYISFALAL